MDSKCGSAECLEVIDKMGQRLGASLSRQQQDGIKSIKELMAAHHDNLAGQIIEFKRTVEKDANDLQPRLRKVESKFDVLDAAIGPEGLDKRIAKVSEAAIDLRTIRGWRHSKSEITIAVISGIIVSLLCAVIIARYIPSEASGKAETKSETHHRTEDPAKKP